MSRLCVLLVLSACKLPTVCSVESDNHQVLDRFWGKLDKSYAVFDVRLEDSTWTEVGEEACASITANSTDDELFDALIGMARTLDDGHIQIESDTRGEDGWADVWPYLDREDQVRQVHIDSYGPLTLAGLDGIAWGALGDIGYIELRRLDEVSESESFLQDRKVFREALDSAFSDLSGSTSWILDLRFNEGGWDYLGLELAGRFATEDHLVWSRAQRNGPEHDNYNKPKQTHLKAKGEIAGNIVVLTSGGTFSAGETLVLAMRELPQVTVMGEATSGHLSDLYERRLPNGWAFSYSGDRYLAADGELYEKRGIPVDIEQDFDAVSFDGGVDTMLDAAIRHLSE